MSTLSSDAIQRCRMRFMGADLFQLLQAKDRKDFAYQSDCLYRPDYYASLRPGEAKTVHLNPKWLKWLDDGVLLQKTCINRLVEAKPELDRVLRNPLWEVLGWDADDPWASIRYLESLKPRNRALVGCTYRDRMHARMRWAMGIPDWERLAFPLALLDTVNYAPQRSWLNQHFFNYLALATLHPAYCECYKDLWALIDEWFSARKPRWGATPALGWPGDIRAFDKRREVFKQGRDFLVENGWLPPEEALFHIHAAMLWCISLGGKPLMDRCMNSILKGVKRCPDWLRRMMRELDTRLNVK
ncbi:hypothetical protein [Pseudomonas pudica]|uniref:Uncharacterized protein n=1 Tax=Pseudomonas pudica TaxID=272772 RepID=A0ABS0FUM5_9PSED|nr:hypothetical protein [Pseudomonas pudica]MBF8644067.1 hypothetical protein [Pseudomonas pudica]MBF8758566.1 hypothetical protein [Pseudomonas pudica]